MLVGVIPYGIYSDFAYVEYLGFDGVQIANFSHMEYAIGGSAQAYLEGGVKFSVHSQTGDIVQLAGEPYAGNGNGNDVRVGLDYRSPVISPFGANEKQVLIAYEFAAGYDVSIGVGAGGVLTVTQNSGSSIAHGPTLKERRLIARNRVDDNNTGFELFVP